jgi:hypothetical protein
MPPSPFTFRIAPFVLLLALPLHPSECCFGQAGRAVQNLPNAGKALKAIVTLVTGAAAAKGFAIADEAHSTWKAKDEILENLRRQGLQDADKKAIYSIFFTLDSDASCVRWADIFNDPDIFVYLQIEGEDDYVFPSITYEYAGQPLLMSFVHREIPSGRRVLVHILDDDTWSDSIWNSILSSRIDYRATASMPCKTLVSARAELNGRLQILDRTVVIDAPDYITTAQFLVPESPDGRWLMSGNLADEKGRKVGQLQFMQVWRPDREAIKKNEQAVGDAIGDKDKARRQLIFWSVFGLVALAVTARLFFSNK